MPEDTIPAVIGLIGSLIGGLIVFFGGRRKNKADAADVVADASISLVKPLTDRLDDMEEKTKLLETKVKTLEKDLNTVNNKLARYASRVISLMNGIQRLIKQIGDLGAAPCWEPDEWKDEE